MRERILSAADGNPLFVEEMVALVQEVGDVRVPATVQALLQARIDQLGGDERAVVERGAVEGETFHRGAVAELARPTKVDPHLVGLVRKELIRPTPPTLVGDQAYRFRHLLIRDAAYDAMPKAIRAELHERFADWLLLNGGELIELDEIVGYHLEQAARYHHELGDPKPELAERAGERLAAAGVRAAVRNDVPGALKLHSRAIALLSEGTPAWEAAFLDRLAMLATTGDDRFEADLERLTRSDSAALRMHAELFRARLAVEAATADSVTRALEVVARAANLFGELDDHRGLAAVAELEGQLAWLRSNATDTASAIERCLEHMSRAGLPDFMGRGMLLRFGPYVWGPFTPDEMRASVADEPESSHPRLVMEMMIAEREGRVEEAIEMTEWAVNHLTELGLRPMLSAPKSARAEMLRKVGRLDESAQEFEEVIALMKSFGQGGYVSTALIDYAETLLARGDATEAERLAEEGEASGGPDDLVNFSKGRALRARVAADRGEDQVALELAHSARDYAYRTDFPSQHGGTHEALGYVHRRAGRGDDARTEYERALEIWQRYGWAANEKRVRELLEEL
jgi:tetratricopeptide (TPR) repeat protein